MALWIANDLRFMDIEMRLGIAVSTAHRIFVQFSESGEVEILRQGHI